jgi:hypothetical protein
VARQPVPILKESNMPLKIFVESLETVPEVLRENYVEGGKSYQLNLSDLDEHVANQLKPLKSDLEITRAHERKLLVENGLGSALQRAMVFWIATNARRKRKRKPIGHF